MNMSPLRGKVKYATRNSDLSLWLAKNADWFLAELREAGTPNWNKITELFAQERITDKNGNPYTKDAIRMAVRRAFKSHVPSASLPTRQPAPAMPQSAAPTIARVTLPGVAVPADTPDFIAISQAIKNKRTVK